MLEKDNLNIFGESGDLDLGSSFDMADDLFGGAESIFSSEVKETVQPEKTPENSKSELTPEPVKEEINDLQTDISEAKPAAEENSAEQDDNPFEAAVAAAKEKKAEEIKSSLKDKLPVFVYGKANEEIADPSITFDKLRYEKSDDFPELDDAQAVKWKVEYGTVSKQISEPKKTTIASIKKDIEKSKEFTDGLAKKKTGKEEDIVCKITPCVAAKKKGFAAEYKGAYTSLADAIGKKKAICYVPSDDGNIYEVRNTKAGAFIAKAQKADVYQKVRAGFIPALPKIPECILKQIIAFFKSYVTEDYAVEAMAAVYWSEQRHRYEVYVPEQRVTGTEISAALPDLPEDEYTLVMEIHSHNRMSAFFSKIDNDDEKATRIYTVIGRLDKFFPQIRTRISVGGKFVEIDPSEVFEMRKNTFPDYWLDAVSIVGEHKEEQL
ncbi:MAG: Mov34/MPN/PAD-1 family protein [Clostridiales bacterium]|nr:Mov34/MPN/PAD-1 family protein [Clostridiales bacterium]